MKILITGVTGFLGSHLAKALLAGGYNVIALKRKESSLRRVESIVSDVVFVDIDGLDFDKFFLEHGKIDVIIHTATCYGRHNESASDIAAANIVFPLRLLDAGRRAGIEAFFNTDTILNKNINQYAFSKKQFLNWGLFFSRHSQYLFTNIKLEQFYGPDDESTKFATYVLNGCLENIPELKLTAGGQKRDFIHIDDVLSAYMLLLKKIDSINTSFAEYVVGTGQAISIREFVETIHRLTKSKTHLSFGSIPYRSGEIMNTVSDISALTALGWRCQYDHDKGLRALVEQEKLRYKKLK